MVLAPSFPLQWVVLQRASRQLLARANRCSAQMEVVLLNLRFASLCFAKPMNSTALQVLVAPNLAIRLRLPVPLRVPICVSMERALVKWQCAEPLLPEDQPIKLAPVYKFNVPMQVAPIRTQLV
jgi:hypothetical protein